jgi:hypothetical protein
MTSVGLLAIDAVDPVDFEAITESDAQAAGHPSLADLRAMLATGRGSTVYRIAFHYAGPDPRVSLREQVPDGADQLRQLRARLARWDSAGASGPWTGAVLQLISRRPGVRAADLAALVGMDRDRFKAQVRKLKGLGLTESLEVGYRLSPRGEAVLADVDASLGPSEAC